MTGVPDRSVPRAATGGPGLVIRGGRLPSRAEPVDVLVGDGVIAAITPVAGERSDARDLDRAVVVDARGCVLLPGLVDAHCHLDKTLFGRPWVPHSADDTLAARIANDRRRRFELGLPDPEAMRALVRRMRSCGTTLLRTHTDVDPDMGLVGVERVRAVADEFAGSVRIQQVAFPQHGLLSRPGTEALLAGALAAGASVLGGLDPSAEGDPRRYLDVLFRLAERAGAGIDLHLHTHGHTGSAELELIVERTRALGMGGRVVVSHAYCFGDLDDSASRAIADRMAGAGVGVVTAAVYDFPVPPLKLLGEAGVVVGCGHDGIRDLWGPYGTGDMLERARQLAYRSTFRTDPDIELALAAATGGGRALLTGDPGGIRVGGPADLVVVPASCAAEAVVAAPPRLVIANGTAVPADPGAGAPGRNE